LCQETRYSGLNSKEYFEDVEAKDSSRFEEEFWDAFRNPNLAQRCSTTIHASGHLPPTIIMGHCLRIPELIRSICDNLDKATSLSVALACKAFLEPGLDKIWRDIDSLEPLAHCLPAEIWKNDRSVMLISLIAQLS
jgi:hypothetical protein